MQFLSKYMQFEDYMKWKIQSMGISKKMPQQKRYNSDLLNFFHCQFSKIMLKYTIHEDG